ncbi:Fe-S biogenesis protein NfuA [Sphingomonas limnosediminicola]|uniref:Fe-S biogenesis protein NfuA n=1 Tax=Sphingomonas limnosediminicola TaxID=940133 RepID=A0ABP7LUQ4_9SPHN
MQTTYATPARSEASARGQTLGLPQREKSFPCGPPVTITDKALKKIVEAKQKLGLPVKGLRVSAHPRSVLRADFSLRFVPAGEEDSPADSIHRYEGIDLYVASDSAPYLEGATIDFVFSLLSSDFKVEAPLRRLDTPQSRTAAKIQQVLDEEVIPALATHGGGAVVVDFKDGVVFLELTGGCQGCRLAGATMKDGIEASIRRSFPEITEVRDVTKHADGKSPYA